MTQQPDDQPPAVESAARSRRWQRTAGAAAVVAVLVVGNATAANATTADATATHATRADPSARSGGPHQSSESPRTQASAALHGEFRVVNRDGSAQLRRWQSGAVDAIDSMSLTVRSADGYDSTYLLGPGVSVTGIGVGDEVTVVGAGQAVSGNS